MLGIALLALALAAWELPTTISAILIAVGVIGKAGHWVYKWAQRIDESLSYIEGEMRFNGGTTMRDSIRRIETRVDTIEHNQEGTQS